MIHDTCTDRIVAGAKRPTGGTTPRPSLRTVEERNALVTANLGLVGAVLARLGFAGHPDSEALWQEGAVGLMRAAETWEPERAAFSTHAFHWIRQAVFRAAQGLALIPLPSKPVGGTRAELREKLQTVPLPGSRYDDRHECCLPDHRADPHAEADAHRQRQAALEAALARLDARSAEVLRMRFYRGLTLDEVGVAIGVTRERARQIQQTALRRLRRLCPALADLAA